jgi:hypothetical protein
MLLLQSFKCSHMVMPFAEDLELWTESMSIKANPSEQIKKLAIFQKERINIQKTMNVYPFAHVYPFGHAHGPSQT